MAHVTESPVRAFAHCPDPRCTGNAQEPVDGVLRHTDVLYTDTDPNGIPGVEKSYDNLSFADESDAPCSHCETFREITQQKRPEYEPLSGQNQRELLRLQDAGDQASQAKDAELMRLQAELAVLRAGGGQQAPAVDVAAMFEQMQAKHDEEMAALRAELASKANKSGPKPKTQEG